MHNLNLNDTHLMIWLKFMNSLIQIEAAISPMQAMPTYDFSPHFANQLNIY